MKNSYIGQAWLVLALAVCFGAALAGVEAGLKGRINQNKRDDTIDQIPSLVPDAVSGEMQMVGDQNVYRALDQNGTPVGWVIPTMGQGFADKIELLIGLNADLSEITGLYVLDQKETPGLGNRIVETEWRDQFIKKSTAAHLLVTKAQQVGEMEIQAVTGATISSESVVSIVNMAVARFRVAVSSQP